MTWEFTLAVRSSALASELDAARDGPTEGHAGTTSGFDSDPEEVAELTP